MKQLFRVSSWAAGLLVAATAFVSAQGADEAVPQNHDRQFIANLGALRMLVQTKTTALTTNSTGYTQLTAGNIQIPSGQTGFLKATLSGESACSGSAGAWCTLRVRVNGVELSPIVGTDFAFDSVGSGTDFWESHSIQRISNRLPAGTYTVEVEWAVVGSASFVIDDWLFQVEYWRAT
jgi:hypothetical protein